MKCPKCGTESEGRFCQNCGEPLQTVNETQNPAPALEPEPIKPETPKKKKKIILKRWWFWVIVVFVLIIVLVAATGNSGSDSQEPTDQAVVEEEGEPDAEDTEVEAEPALAPEPAETMDQKQAVRKAESYLRTFAFSRSGLIEQIEFEGFSHEDAVYAVDHIVVDWNEQAVRKAESYLDSFAFSRSELVEQLEFEGFTPDQAEYGVSQVWG